MKSELSAASSDATYLRYSLPVGRVPQVAQLLAVLVSKLNAAGISSACDFLRFLLHKCPHTFVFFEVRSAIGVRKGAIFLV